MTRYLTLTSNRDLTEMIRMLLVFSLMLAGLIVTAQSLDFELTNNTINENASNGTYVGTLTPINATVPAQVNFVFVAGTGDTDNALFNRSGRDVSLNGMANYEVKDTYSIRVQADDQGDLVEKVLLIYVNDVNEAPTLVNVSATSIQENNDIGQVVAILSTEDPDEGDTFTYFFDATEPQFTIDGNQVLANEEFDFETLPNTYRVGIYSRDAGFATSPTRVIDFSVTNQNETPTDISLSSTSIFENNASGSAFVGTASTTDEDDGETFTYTIVSGFGDDDKFEFSGDDLQGTEPFNFEEKSEYSIRIQSEDAAGASLTKDFTISISDAPESPFDIQLSNSNIEENNEIGDLIGELTVSDPDLNDTFTFSILTTPADGFSFDVVSGNELVADEEFDFENKNSYTIRIVVRDQTNRSYIEEFTISIVDVNENNTPTDITLSDNSFEETRQVGYTIGSFSTVDLDEGETYTYTFAEGDGDDDNGNFSISGTSLKVGTTFDFETQDEHTIRIQTNDGNGGIFSKALLIAVEDDPEVPTDITLSASSISEGNEIGDVIGALSTEDPDIGDTHSYSILTIGGSTDHTAFDISGSNLVADAVFDFETKSSYTIRIRTQDAIGDSYTEDFVITIDDVDEPIEWNGSAWVGGLVPQSTDDVIINGNFFVRTNGEFGVNDLTVNNGFTLTVNGSNRLTVEGDIINNGSLVVESGSSLITYDGNSFTGNDVEIRRNTRFDDGRYSFVGTPVEQNAGVTDVTIGDYVYYYDETESFTNMDGLDRWDEMVGELVPGRGYTQANQEEIIFTGIPNTGTIVHAGTYTEDALDENEGWNLVANPYAAGINVTDFLAANTNTSGAIYIWDDNGSDSQRGSNDDYIVANGTMANSNVPGDMDADRYNDHVGSSQGFFVKLNNAANTDITFTETMRRIYKSADDNFFRESQLPIARINLTDNNGLFKQAVIGFANDASNNELNKTYDAQAFNASSDYGLYSIKEGRSLTLNGMTSGWQMIQLQVNTAEAGIYQISAELGEYSQHIYLRDRLTEEVIDLKNGGYSFSAQAGINTDRFELISSPSNVLGLESEEAFIYTSNKILHIEKQTKEAKEFQLFNMNGKLLLSTSVESKKEVNLTAYPSGIYLVFDGQKTHKIILK